MKRVGVMMLVALVVLVSGCDIGLVPETLPPDSVETAPETTSDQGESDEVSSYSIYLRNEYADSLFSIHYKINDGNWVEEHNDERAGYYEIVSISFEADSGDTIVVRITAISIGQEHVFLTDPIEVSDDIYMIYDYDFATASFGIWY